MTRRQANTLIATLSVIAVALVVCALQLARIHSDTSSIEGSQADQVELLKQNPGRQR